MIQGSHFLIRTLMADDLDTLLLLLSDISKQGDFLPGRLMSQTTLRKDFEKHGYWEDARYQQLVMVDEAGAIIGMIWIFKSTPYFDALELGYKIFDRAQWGQGLMTEATTLVVDYLFATKQINRLEIRCDVENRASARVAEKLGFTHEGVSRQAVFANGAHHDMDVYALLREGWTAASKQGKD
jgi:ribosomal-protein-alanine N-acetyltransferase